MLLLKPLLFLQWGALIWVGYDGLMVHVLHTVIQQKFLIQWKASSDICRKLHILQFK